MTEFDKTHFGDHPNTKAPPHTELFVNGLKYQTSDQRKLERLETRGLAMCQDLSLLGGASRNQRERNFSALFVTACHLGALDGDLLLPSKMKLSVPLAGRIAYISTLLHPSTLPSEVLHFLDSDYCRTEPTSKAMASKLTHVLFSIFLWHDVEVSPISFRGVHFERDLAFLLEASPLAFEQARSVDYLLARDFQKRLDTDLLRDAKPVNEYLSQRLDYLRSGGAPLRAVPLQ